MKMRLRQDNKQPVQLLNVSNSYQVKLLLRIPTEIHKLMCSRARIRNISRNLWIIRAIIENIKKELEND